MAMTSPLPRPAVLPAPDLPWLAERLGEARAIVAAASDHRDSLVRLACDLLITHGATAREREDARILRLVIDARRPLRHGDHQRPDRYDDPEGRR
jgi:hypothetical protein